jgi:hypothetical protein
MRLRDRVTMNQPRAKSFKEYRGDSEVGSHNQKKVE